MLVNYQNSMKSLSQIKNKCIEEDELYKKYMVNKEIHLSKIKDSNRLKNEIKKEEFNAINKSKFLIL